MKYSEISSEQFIIIWQQAKDVREVADKTGIIEASCRSRANFYRSKGIRLKNHCYRTKPLDVEHLKKVAREYGGGK